MQRAELPRGLGHAFTVEAAETAGVSRSRLRARDLSAPNRGVRVRLPLAVVHADDPFERWADDVRERARHYALVMPDSQFFTHVTAALLYRLPVPGWLLWSDAGVPSHAASLDVGAFAPVRAPRARGLRGHQLLASHASVRTMDGLRIASPAATWAMLAAVVKDVRDVVALGDAVVREQMFKTDPPALATRDDLEAAVQAGRRLGIASLRTALPLVRTRSASRRETWCRLALGDAGLPEPALNWNVHDVAGRFIACVDLAFPALKVAVEYEGEHHLSPEQWARDIERHARLVELGWIVIRVTKRQLLDAPHQFVSRVRRAIAARS